MQKRHLNNQHQTHKYIQHPNKFKIITKSKQNIQNIKHIFICTKIKSHVYKTHLTTQANMSEYIGKQHQTQERNIHNHNNKCNINKTFFKTLNNNIDIQTRTTHKQSRNTHIKNIHNTSKTSIKQHLYKSINQHIHNPETYTTHFFLKKTRIYTKPHKIIIQTIFSPQRHIHRDIQTSITQNICTKTEKQ